MLNLNAIISVNTDRDERLFVMLAYICYACLFSCEFIFGKLIIGQMFFDKKINLNQMTIQLKLDPTKYIVNYIVFYSIHLNIWMVFCFISFPL